MLYDASKDILSGMDSEAILRNFHLMVMGNFGVAEGVLITTRWSAIPPRRPAAKTSQRFVDLTNQTLGGAMAVNT
jgi:hypothetical protein